MNVPLLSITPLDNWIAKKIGLKEGLPLTREALISYQFKKLRDVLTYVRTQSPFYQAHFKDLPSDPLKGIADWASLPFTYPEDIKENSLSFLCVSQSDIARVVTLMSSGTIDKSKRLFFTEADLDLTVDFFHHGMSTFVKPGQRVLILMPGQTPGSVGDLLVKGLARMDAEGIVHGPVQDPEIVIQEIIEKRIDSLVGIPGQVLTLARHPAGARIPEGQIKSVLLSADYVPQAVVDALTKAWAVPVFNHYGTTESGLGGGVECRALAGYHLREADLYFEIIDPHTGCLLPEGAQGEVVFTTLTRQGMPLVRYRTGDLAAFITKPCPCGTCLRRMDRVAGRIEGDILIGKGSINITDLDEKVLAIPEILTYRAEVSNKNGRDDLCLFVTPVPGKRVPQAIIQAVKKIPAIRHAAAAGSFEIEITESPPGKPSTGMIKRKLLDKRSQL